MSSNDNRMACEDFKKMLGSGIIAPVSPAWSFTLLIETNKDRKYRFCVDYRKLNQRMKRDRWPITKIQGVLDNLKSFKVFPTLGLFGGY